MSELGQIGLFQLINLRKNKVPFQLFAVDVEEVPLELIAYLENTNFLKSSVFESEFKNKCPDVNSPVILFCFDGLKSKNLALQLGDQGYLNIYTFKGGVKGLLIEAQQGL